MKCFILYFNCPLCSIIIFRSSKESMASQMKKHMVESKQLESKGLQTGALEANKSDMLFLGGDWQRVCAPLKKERMHSLVFWTKDGPNDTPSWGKQVSNLLLVVPMQS
jgi:hypothetical protein